MSKPTVTHLVAGKPHLGARLGNGKISIEITPEISGSGKKVVVNRYTLNVYGLSSISLEELPELEAIVQRAKRHMIELSTKHVGKNRSQ